MGIELVKKLLSTILYSVVLLSTIAPGFEIFFFFTNIVTMVNRICTEHSQLCSR